MRKFCIRTHASSDGFHRLECAVKNSYNIGAPGTVIGHSRGEDLHKDWLLTSIVQKKDVTMLDITSHADARAVWLFGEGVHGDGGE